MKTLNHFAWCIASVFLCTLCIAPVWAQINLNPDWAKRGGAINSQNVQTNTVLSITTDKHGNSYILSSNIGIVNIDGHTVAPDSSASVSLTSWDCFGNFRWMKTFGSKKNTNSIARTVLATDTLEGIYVAGQLISDSVYLDADTTIINSQNSLVLFKYNSAGVFQWLRIPRTSNSMDSTTSVSLSVTPNGDAYWMAYLKPGSYAGNAFTLTTPKYGIMRYDAAGMFQNFTPLAISGKGVNYYMDFSRNDRNGKIYVVGSLDTSVGSITIGTTNLAATGSGKMGFLAAFNSSGTNIWVKHSLPNKNLGLLKPIIDKDGMIYLGGSINIGNIFLSDTVVNSNANQYSMGLLFAMAADSNGNKAWSTYASPSNTIYELTAMALKNNTLVITGTYGDTLKWGSLLLPKVINSASVFYVGLLDASSGIALKVDTIVPNIIGSLANTTIDKNSNVYIGGSFANQITFGSTTLQKLNTNPNPNYNDFFIAKYQNAPCNCNLLQPEFTLTPSPGGQNYKATYTGDMPYTSIKWTFGDGTTVNGTSSPSHTYLSKGSFPICVTVVNGCGSNSICHWVTNTTLGINDPKNTEKMEIFPNPAWDEITLKNAPSDATLEIYNLQGQRVSTLWLNGKGDKISVSTLASGFYFLQVTDQNGTRQIAKFLKQ
ncbi:MAG: T9SS type A sorting domain-containing protein [Bacteroidetes bacterium]|nr:T9SS type A sorting domain-containing protein [Bacteroidota bacterium]